MQSRGIIKNHPERIQVEWVKPVVAFQNYSRGWKLLARRNETELRDVLLPICSDPLTDSDQDNTSSDPT